jgi:hypothetical protein
LWFEKNNYNIKNMAYPPPQGNFSYQRAYPPNYDQNPYPPAIGFQNYIATDPVQPSQNTPYPPTTVAYHGTPLETQHGPRSNGNSFDDIPEVGFERYERKPHQPSAKSASGVELENVEELQDDFGNAQLDEQLSDNSTTRIQVCILFCFVEIFEGC